MCRLCVNLTYRQTKAVLVIYPYFTASQGHIVVEDWNTSDLNIFAQPDLEPANNHSATGSESFFIKAEKCHYFRIQSKGEELQDEGPTL